MGRFLGDNSALPAYTMSCSALAGLHHLYGQRQGQRLLRPSPEARVQGPDTPSPLARPVILLSTSCAQSWSPAPQSGAWRDAGAFSEDVGGTL